MPKLIANNVFFFQMLICFYYLFWYSVIIPLLFQCINLIIVTHRDHNSVWWRWCLSCHTLGVKVPREILQVTIQLHIFFSIWYINFRLGLYYGYLIKKGGFKEYEKDCLRNPILGNITKFWHNNDYEGFHYHVTAGLS